MPNLVSFNLTAAQLGCVFYKSFLQIARYDNYTTTPSSANLFFCLKCCRCNRSVAFHLSVFVSVHLHLISVDVMSEYLIVAESDAQLSYTLPVMEYLHSDVLHIGRSSGATVDMST